MMPTQEHLLNVNISMMCHGLMAHHLLMSNYKMSKLLFLFFILFLNINNAFATDKIHLVSVGIADYPGTSNDLTLPAKDAASESKGFFFENKKSRKRHTIAHK